VSLFIGDALSMPVHWYYNINDIIKDFGAIKFYQAPKQFHPSSIMSLSNTGAAGRGDQKGDIVGRVILKGKKEFWGKSGTHYHQGMKPGENTLNIVCARVLIRSIGKGSALYDPKKFLDDYVQLMTTEGSHNDTYAESYHRDFFRNFDAGLDLLECAGKEGHNTASMGGVVSIPIICMLYYGDVEEAIRQSLVHLHLTHRSPNLDKFVIIYVRIFCHVLSRPQSDSMPLQDIILSHCNESGISQLMQLGDLLKKYPQKGDAIMDSNVVGGFFSSACYIDDSMPSLLYLACKYGEDGIEEALLANTNVGGENCHRGAVLGALLGAYHGSQKINPKFVLGLDQKVEIQQEIDEFLTLTQRKMET
jgi:ADP-ribosyl-[dinitrogen reductase] hydrolase